MKIQSLSSRPGHIARGRLAVDGVSIPVAILEGSRPGPAIYLQAAQHPTEMVGVEVMHRLASELDPRRLRGTIVMAPVAHPVHAAWRNGLDAYRDLASPRQKARLARINPNRRWPGRPNGHLIDRINHVIYDGICRQVDAIVDFHCCRICDEYFAAALDGHGPSLELAKAFGAPLVDLATEKSFAAGLLYLVAPADLDVPAILVEMSPGFDVTPDALANGLRGTYNLLKHLGMLPGRPTLPRMQVVVRRGDRVRIYRAKREGYVTTYRRVGEPVAKGTLLCEVRGLDTFRVLQTVRAPYDGTPPSIGPGGGCRMVKVGEEICTFKRVVEVVRSQAAPRARSGSQGVGSGEAN